MTRFDKLFPALVVLVLGGWALSKAAPRGPAQNRASTSPGEALSQTNSGRSSRKPCDGWSALLVADLKL